MYNYKDQMFIKMKILRICILCIACILPSVFLHAQSPSKEGPLGTFVNVISGNLYLEREDILLPGRGISIEMKFSYNSFLHHAFQNGYGNGWTFNYDVSYYDDTATNNRIILWGDGSESEFIPNGSGGYKPQPGIYDKLTEPEAGKLLLTDVDGYKYFFDNAANKKLTRLEDLVGNSLSFSYSGENLVMVTHSSGLNVQLEYNAEGMLTSIIDNNATPEKVYTYSYDNDKNLVSVKDPLNGEFNYTYQINGTMSSVSDRNNNVLNIIYFPDFTIRELVGCNKRISFSYANTLNSTIVTDHMDDGTQDITTVFTYVEDEYNSWITSVKGNCCGFDMKFEYDKEGNVLSETDGRGLTTQFSYDTVGRMTTITDPMGNRTFFTYAYGDLELVSSITDPKGNRTQYEYDEKGNLVKLINPDNTELTATYSTQGDIATFTDPKGNIYNYTYNSLGYPILIQGPESAEIELNFDTRGNFISFRDANENNYTIEFDILSRLKKITGPGNIIHQFDYDANGNIVSYKDPGNMETFYFHDASNRLVKITDPAGLSMEGSYDAMDNVISVKNPLGHEVKYSYNALNEIASLTDMDGNKAEADYDASGNLVSIRLQNGLIYNISYDNNNRPTKISDNIGDLAVLTYDPNGNITSFTNSKGGKISATYDKKNRIVSSTDVLGNTTKYTYDSNNKVTSVTDRHGRSEYYTYDGLNRLKTYTDKNGAIAEFSYDNAGNVISIKDQNNNITTYTYDELHRRKSMTFPDGTYKEINYDTRGNIASLRDSDGSVSTFTYDELNQIKTKTLPGGEVLSINYDEIGRIISITNNTGTVEMEYDEMDRLISETFNGRTVQYSYDVTGRTSSTEYPDGTVITKEYDIRNRLWRIKGNNELIAEYTYDNGNQIIESKFSNGINTSYQYDFANRLNRKTTTLSNLFQTNYSYDKEGNKTLISRPDNPSLSEQFSYDNNSRLINYKRGSGSNLVEHSYTYDNLGNRVSANINGASVSYNSNNLNQLIAAGGQALEYNERGSLIFDGVYYKSYDGSGRLVRDSSAAGVVQHYRYDPLGRLAEKTVGGIKYKYTYSRYERIEERDNSDNVLQKTVYAFNFMEPLMLENADGSFYYHQNELGSVEAITSASGRLVEKYHYDPYGKPIIIDSNNTQISSSLVQNKIAFTGQEYDHVTNSYRFFYRTYSPELGVFNQRDLIEYEDGLGMYQYVGNNPANGIDIWGLNCVSTTESKSTSRKMYENATWATGWGGALTHDMSVEGARRGMQDVGKRIAANGGDWAERGENLGVFANNKLLKGMSAAGDKIGFADQMLKGANFLETTLDGSPSNPQHTEEWTAGAELGFSLIGNTPAGKILGAADFATEKLTGESLLTHTGNTGTFLGENITRWENGLPINWQWGEPIDEDWRPFWNKEWWSLDYHRRKSRKKKCKEKGTPRRIEHYNPLNGRTYLIWSIDPNEIVGPEGVADPKWVSVDDRMQYTIFCENSELATGPARVVKISTPIEPKHDATTINLGSFGFNGLEFEVPAGLATYSARLDVRDSLGVYVDVIAGYDPNTNSVFWNFSSIDPVTFLPSTDPTKGVLLLRSDEFEKHGHGFVNFSIKPRRTAETGDTTGARAEIVFDDNEMIPTNIHHNTIDAVAPESNITEFSTTENLVQLRWNGADDPGGSGIATYALYVANDRLNYSLFGNPTTSKDTSFTLAVGQEYCFFVLATDSTGNVEKMMPDGISCLELRGALPVTWLYFEGENIGKNNKLNWATASEQNSKEFLVERSVDGKEYMPIALVPAAGNSSIKTYYEYIDKEIDKLNSVMMYYRLRQIDLDGKYVFSKTITLRYTDIGFEPSIVYPNPTHSFAIIKIGEKSLLKTEAILMDVNGKILERIKIESEYQQVDLSKYLKGMYFIQLANKQVLRVVRQ